MWLEDGIIFSALDFNSSLENTEVDKGNVEAIAKAGNGIKRPLLVDVRHLVFAGRKTREYYAEELPKHVTAVAYIVASPVSRMVMNVFLRINRPSFPAELFASQAEAVEWLKEFRAG